MIGKLWPVDKTLENVEGLRWVRERLGDYDWSKVEWITSDADGVSGTRFEACVNRPRRGAGTGSTVA